MNELKLTPSICFTCEMLKYSLEKRQNEAFYWERKEEFYPTEEFGPYVYYCLECHEKLMELYS